MRTRNFIAITALSVSMAACAGDEKEREVEIGTPKEVKKEKKDIPAYADAGFKDGMVESALPTGSLKLRRFKTLISGKEC